LERYHRETLDLRHQDPVHGQFGVLIRAERYERYKAAMEEGRLRRERLTLFFTRVIDTKVPVAGHRAVAEYFDALSRKESLALCDFAMGVLARLFADCRVTPMRDRDHFLFYYRFLNTNLQTTNIDPLDLFDPGYSIQQNCLHAERNRSLCGRGDFIQTGLLQPRDFRGAPMAAPDISGNHRGADRNGVPRVCDHNERFSQARRQGD
jgi:hypothetical protein